MNNIYYMTKNNININNDLSEHNKVNTNIHNIDPILLCSFSLKFSNKLIVI